MKYAVMTRKVRLWCLAYFYWYICCECNWCRVSFDVSPCFRVGVAQWLGRRSVAGGLSLIYAWSMVDVWPLCG